MLTVDLTLATGNSEAMSRFEQDNLINASKPLLPSNCEIFMSLNLVDFLYL